MRGEIRNYLAYALQEEATLVGVFDFQSDHVNVDEWMVAEEEETTEEVNEETQGETEVDTTAVEVARIPTNIDFVLTSSIEQLVYDNLSIDNFAGQVIVRDGALRLNQVNFKLLDGYFEMNGAYESVPIEPLYDFDLAIKELSIPKAFASLEMVKKLAPFAEKMTGDFSTDFQIDGSLLQDMSPNYETMHGYGLLNVANAALQEVKLLNTVSGFTGGNLLKGKDEKVTLKDVLMQTEIKEGRVFVKPFDLGIAGYKASISREQWYCGRS